MTAIDGRCLCGAVRYRIEGAALVMYHCHCAQCRRASGASFATNLLVRTEMFQLTSGADAIASFESSPGKRRCFCSRCGSPIYSAADATPQIRSIRGGTVEGDPGVRPTAHIHVASKSPWFEITDGLPEREFGLAD